MMKSKDPRINIRVSRKAYEELKKKAIAEDRSIVSMFNVVMGV